jgi:predicted patatin/cPLA2 family phospholipase
MLAGVGLVLEGGGMRTTYTGGVLDAFMDAGVDLGYVIGVSAGANAGSHYVAGQRERSHRVFVDLVADPRYAGWRNVMRERSWFGMDFLFRLRQLPVVAPGAGGRRHGLQHGRGAVLPSA